MNIDDIVLFKRNKNEITTINYEKIPKNPLILTQDKYDKFDNSNSVRVNKSLYENKKLIKRNDTFKKEGKILFGTAGLKKELMDIRNIQYTKNKVNPEKKEKSINDNLKKIKYTSTICYKNLEKCVIEYTLPKVINTNLIEVKIYSNIDLNCDIKMCVDGKELPKSNKLLNKNWVTINYIDPEIHINPNVLTIESKEILNLKGIYCEEKSKNNIITDNINLSCNISNKMENYKKSKINDVCIGIISDNFTYENINYLFNTVYIKPNTNLDNVKIDILMCESAWAGIDEQWRDKIFNLDINSPNICKTSGLIYILNQCKRKLIPTVYYAKEDPIFYDGFHKCSKLFDLVITTSKECVAKYKQYGCKKVMTTTFLINPIIHNPIRNEMLTKIAFPGSYYTFLDNRSNIMDKILENFCSKNLDIYDRKYLHNKSTYQIKKLQINKGKCEFPQKYDPLIKPGLTYSQVINNVYKKYKCILNINTVSDSQTMFSRRAMEVAGCGTNIISNYSVGMDKIFGDNIYYLNEKNGFKFTKNLNDMPNINVNVYEIAHLNYTYKHLFKKIFKQFNIEKTLDSKICILTNHDTIMSMSVKTSYPILYNITDKIISNFEWIICLYKNNYYYTDDFLKKIILPIEYVDDNISISKDNNIFKFNVGKIDYDTYVLNTKKITIKYPLFDNLKTNFSINNIYNPLYENCFNYTKYLPDIFEQSIVKNDDVNTQVIVMCQWKRINNLENIIQSLNSQTYKNFHLYIWNNNTNEKNLLKNIIDKKQHKFNISWYNCEENIGGFGRFIMVKCIISKIKLENVIFIDDDQLLKTNVIMELVKKKKKKCGFHWSGRKFYKDKNYWDSWSNIFSENNNEKYDILDYGGTGVMIIDTEIFNSENFYYLNKKYIFIEDLWMSYFSIKEHNYQLHNCSDLDVIMNDDGKNQSLNIKIKNLKNEFLNDLRKFGKWNV